MIDLGLVPDPDEDEKEYLVDWDLRAAGAAESVGEDHQRLPRGVPQCWGQGAEDREMLAVFASLVRLLDADGESDETATRRQIEREAAYIRPRPPALGVGEVGSSVKQEDIGEYNLGYLLLVLPMTAFPIDPAGEGCSSQQGLITYVLLQEGLTNLV